MYGPRVPAVVVSPYSKPHAVTNVVHDHTSVLATIEAQWNLPALTYRDANAATLADFLGTTMAFAKPPKLVAPANPLPGLKTVLAHGQGTPPPPDALSVLDLKREPQSTRTSTAAASATATSSQLDGGDHPVVGQRLAAAHRGDHGLPANARDRQDEGADEHKHHTDHPAQGLRAGVWERPGDTHSCGREGEPGTQVRQVGALCGQAHAGVRFAVDWLIVHTMNVSFRPMPRPPRARASPRGMMQA